jgi:hypothetical protein
MVCKPSMESCQAMSHGSEYHYPETGLLDRKVLDASCLSWHRFHKKSHTPLHQSKSQLQRMSLCSNLQTRSQIHELSGFFLDSSATALVCSMSFLFILNTCEEEVLVALIQLHRGRNPED